MSDQYGSYGPNHPYGQSPYGGPPFPGQQPPPPGQPYGQGFPPPYGKDPDKRPGTVLAAGLITIILSALTALIGLAAAIGASVKRDWIKNHVLDDPTYNFDRNDVDRAIDAFIGVSIALVVLSVLAIIAAAFVLRRSNVARILLVVLSGITVAGSLLSISSLLSAVTLIGAIVVIVLLFVGGSNDWFRRTKIVPYGQQPPW